ncbi:MAG: hypothetical protein ABF242_09490 [Flavobacteriales bacterium]
MHIVGLIIAALLFSFPGIVILLLLFYDHRRKPEIALKYTIGFFAFIGIGTMLLFNYYMLTILLAPILIWVYFFVMVYRSQKIKKD